MATATQVPHDKSYFLRAREIFVRISLIAVLAITCFIILKPFVPLLTWGIIIAAAGSPGYRKVCSLIGGREKLAAVLCTLLLLSIVILPAVLLAGTLTEGIQSLTHHLQKGDFNVPAPPAKIQSWPLVGDPLYKMWSLASTNLAEVLNKVAPLLQERAPAILSAGAQIGGTLIQFILAILLAGFLLANSRSNAELVSLLFRRIFGSKGPEFESLTETTIRSVTNGILGVALIQSALASVGFLAVGLPGAGLWAGMFFVASVLQIGPVILIPSVVYAFTITSTTTAIVFLVWCLIVGLTDNILKPLLLGRGSQVPTLVIFLGVLGGFVAMGIIGLFVGAIILAVGYKLFLAWLHDVDLSVTPEALTN